MFSRKSIGFFLGISVVLAALLTPEIEGLSQQAKYVAAVAILMAIWWITEAIPIFATAFLPMVLFPTMGIMPAGDTAINYGHDLVLMMISGFFLARAIEVHNLHKRIALFIIKTLGTSRRKILLSMMLATAFLSMWIANVTAALLMLPIGIAIISKEESSSGHIGKFGVALMLAIAYSASIGGTATLIGSPTNLIFSGVMSKMFPEAPLISFTEWLKLGLPLVVIFLPIVWLYLTRFFKIKGSILGNKDVITEEYNALGKMSIAEKRVSIVFFLTALGWIFRENIEIGQVTITGWSNLLGLEDFVRDSTVGMLAAVVLFLLPAGNDTRLLNWKQASQIPWGVGVIVGGGYAIANGFKNTGLAEWLGNQLVFVSAYPDLLILFIVVGFILIFTEMNPNTATANIFLPILASMAVAGNINPLLLMVPATFASSFVFMMPAGTGPNTVIFGSNRVSVFDMAKCGLGLKLISLVVLTLVLYFLIIPLLGMESTMPSWAY